VGQWPGWQRGVFFCVEVQGDFAYVTGTGGLTIINVVDPARSQPVGRFDHGGDLAVSGRYAYLANGSGGLDVIDVGTPSNPTRVSGWNGEYDVFGRWVGGYVSSVAISGQYLYLIDTSMRESWIGPEVGGLIVLDISNPATPQLVGSSAFPNTQQNGFDSLKVSKSFAFVGYYGGTLVMDVTNPAQPVFKARYGISSTEVPPDYSLSPGHVFLAHGGRMMVADVTNPTNLFIVGTYDTGGWTRSVAVDGHVACVANGDREVRLYDVSNPSVPALLATFQTEGYAVDVAAAAGRAYIISTDDLSKPYWELLSATARVEVIDLSSPSNPTRLGIYREIPGYSHGVAVAGDTAYIADDKAGLQVVNVADLRNPVRVGTYDTPGDALGVAIAGDIAFVADGPAGLQILYVRDPGAPIRLSGYNSPGHAYGVTVASGYAYLADGAAGMQIVRVSTPASPLRVGGYDTTGTAYGVAVNGTTACVADGQAGLQVMDVSTPASPQRVGGYDTDGEVMGVALLGNYALVADRLEGLHVLNIANPQNPRLVGRISNNGITNNIGSPHSIAVHGQFAYVVGGGDTRLYRVDLTDPVNPKLAGVFKLRGGAFGVAVSGDKVFLADGRSGLEILGDMGFRIGAVRPSVPGGPLRIRWNVLPERSYRAEFTTNLGDINVNWQNLPAVPVIQGTQGEVTDTEGGSSPRFYRVIEE